MAFTVPADRTGRTASPAYRGNCAATSRSTSPARMSASPECIFGQASVSRVMPPV